MVDYLHHRPGYTHYSGSWLARDTTLDGHGESSLSFSPNLRLLPRFEGIPQNPGMLRGGEEEQEGWGGQLHGGAPFRRVRDRYMACAPCILAMPR